MILGNTLAEERVFPNRVIPLWEKELPAICVYTLNDSPSIEVEAPRSLKIALDLIVEVTVKMSEWADDLVDTICMQVEDLISQDYTLGETAMDCLLGTTDITASGEGNQPTLSAKIKFDVTYRRYWPEEITGPDALTDLHSISSQIENKNPAGGSADIDTNVHFNG